jgi:hypothetical protein
MGRQVVPGGIVVQTTGDVLDSARDYVRKQIGAFLRRLPDPLLPARVKLTARAGAPWSALAQANVEVDGQVIRAQVAAAFFRHAGHLLRERLVVQMARLANPAVPRPWIAEQSSPAVPVSQPGGRGEIVRRKCYPLVQCVPDRAALTMDLRDYDFHLFVDAETGQDSVIYRVGPTGYRLARLSGMAPPSVPVSVPLTVNVHEVPRLTLEQAVERLDATELPFRFFRDATTDRGAVLYRRYDGHYGLLTSAQGSHGGR